MDSEQTKVLFFLTSPCSTHLMYLRDYDIELRSEIRLLLIPNLCCAYTLRLSHFVLMSHSDTCSLCEAAGASLMV